MRGRMMVLLAAVASIAVTTAVHENAPSGLTAATAPAFCAKYPAGTTAADTTALWAFQGYLFADGEPFASKNHWHLRMPYTGATGVNALLAAHAERGICVAFRRGIITSATASLAGSRHVYDGNDSDNGARLLIPITTLTDGATNQAPRRAWMAATLDSEGHDLSATMSTLYDEFHPFHTDLYPGMNRDAQLVNQVAAIIITQGAVALTHACDGIPASNGVCKTTGTPPAQAGVSGTLAAQQQFSCLLPVAWWSRSPGFAAYAGGGTSPC